MFLPQLSQPPPFPLGAIHPAMPADYGGPQQDHAQAGPSQVDFMNSIRDVAVFAWALTGINGSLADYSRGKPIGESQPPDGFLIWQPELGDYHSAAPPGYVSAPGSANQFLSSGRDPFGDPGLGTGSSSSGSAGVPRYS